MKNPDAADALLNTIVECAASHVHRWIRRLGIPERDCEDVAQDVLIVVFRHAHTYDPSRSLYPWLGSIAYRTAKDYRRRARNRYEVLGIPIDHGDVAIDSNAEERLAAAEEQRLVLEMVDAIKPNRRQVLLRYECDDMSMAEVATELGIPLNTGYRRLRLARAELRLLWRRRVDKRPVTNAAYLARGGFEPRPRGHDGIRGHGPGRE